MVDSIIQNQQCDTIVFSDKSFLGIIAETYERSQTETGGILLGKIVGNTWYVIESLDPGPNSVFQQSYFEYDTPYVTHLANKITRFYQTKLQLLGLWHRHPGSFDSFSSTDDSTNREYALRNSAGAISGLVNLDPDFRLTIYHVLCPNDSLVRPKYRKILTIKVGDREIPSDLLSFKKPEDYFPRKLNNRSNASESHNSNNFLKTFHFLANNLNKEIPKITSNREVSRDDFSEDQSKSQTEQFLDTILTIIETELDYLDSQHDYKYTICKEGNQIKIDMKYIGEFQVYPRSLKWTFYFVENNVLVTELNRDKHFEYEPNIIKKCIKKIVDRAYS